MNPWKEKVLAYNRRQAVRQEKAADLEILAGALTRLPPGQLKQILTDEIRGILIKYGYGEE